MKLSPTLLARLEADYTALEQQALDAYRAHRRATARGDEQAAALHLDEMRAASTEANELRADLEAAGVSGPFPAALNQTTMWSIM